MTKILIFIDWYIPAYKAGGQIRSVANIVKLLGNEFQFSIVTSDRDLGDSQTMNGIETDKWLETENGRIIYLTPKFQSFFNVKQLLKTENFDILYLNSFFSFRFTILPLFILKFFHKKKKIVLAPRGMLAKNALAIKSGKKNLFLLTAKLLGLYKKIEWHASTELELKEIQNIFGENEKIGIASDIAILPQKISKNLKKEKGNVKLVFLSRICEKKNLHFALEILEELNETGIQFDIIGPIDSIEYYEKCKKIADKLKNRVEVNFLGSVPNHKLQEILPKYHFLFFPTLNENFGHVIAEALSAGCPLIISDNTPWQKLNEKNVGWDINLNKRDDYKLALKLALNMQNDEFQIMVASCTQYLQNQLDMNQILKNNRDIFCS